MPRLHAAIKAQKARHSITFCLASFFWHLFFVLQDGILIGLFDLANLLFPAAKYWRSSVSLFTAASAVLVLCFWFDSPAIRWIAGLHLVIAIITAGLIWDNRRGRLRNDKT